MRRFHKTVWIIVFCLSPHAVLPIQAWNRTGHMVIADIAYSTMTPSVRRRVDELLQHHPDYQEWLEGAGTNSVEPGRLAFWTASYWPDTIRGDPRFFDDGAQPTPPIPGFPDMGRHQMWHYIDRPFSTDGTPVPESPPIPNVLTQIAEFRKSISDPAVSPSVRAYQLAWLIHLVGDVHQPLHCVSRFANAQRDQQTNAFIGDQGGNLVLLEDGRTLHAYWDGLLGGADDPASVSALARDLMRSVKKEKPAKLDEREWVDTGFQLAAIRVYAFAGAGTRESPAILDAHYESEAKRIGRQRAALAGYRLAAVLEKAFGNGR